MAEKAHILPIEIDDPVCNCRVSLRVLLHFVGSDALYLMVYVCQTNSLGSRREGGIIGRKSPTFVDFRQADTENFGQGLRSVHLPWIFRPLYTRTLAVQSGPISTLEKCMVGWNSMPYFWFSWKRAISLSKFDSVTFKCLLNLKAPFYIILQTVIYRGFGECQQAFVCTRQHLVL